MQHETSYPARLGFDEFDVSNSYCEYVVEQATQWLEDAPQLLNDTPRQPFLLTAGFFETHRPYPPDRYEPADPTTVTVPDYLPDTDEVRQDLADFYGAITVADAAVGRLLDTLSAGGLDDNTWVVFMTDHGPGVATREVDALRRGHRDRPDRPPAVDGCSTTPRSTTNCSAAWICCPPCSTCSASTYLHDIDGISHSADAGSFAADRYPRAHRGVHHQDLSRLL